MADIDPGVVLQALKTLTSAHTVPSCSTVSNVSSGFDSLLEHNISVLENELSTNGQQLQDILNDDSSVIPGLSDTTTRQTFVSYCLRLLNNLHLSLKARLKEYAKTPQPGIRPSGGPKISPDTLNFEEQKTVQTAIQFIICLGVCPYLHNGVGLPLSMRTGFSSLVGTGGEEGVSEYEKQCWLFVALKVLISCAFVPSLGTLILTQHLADILGGLVQLIHVSTSKVTDVVRENVSKEVEQSSKKRSECSKVLVSSDNMEVQTPASVVDKVMIPEACKKHIDLHKTSKEKGEGHLDECSAKCASSANTVDTFTDGGRDSCVLTVDEVDILYCEQKLEELMTKVYPPLLVKTLLLLQGGPKQKKQTFNKRPTLQPAPDWLRQFCGQQLSMVVMRPKGVQSVLRGMLDRPGTGQGLTDASDWRKCDAVARVIACCPLQSVSHGDYYSRIAPQVLELLHIPDQQVCAQFLRVACTTIVQMYRHSGQLTDIYILQPLLYPLLLCLQRSDSNQKVIITDHKLDLCIQDCHKVYVCGGTDRSLLMVSLKPVITVIFTLWLVTVHGVWTHKKLCQEILASYLKNIEKDEALQCLKVFSLQLVALENETRYPRMHPDLSFTNTDAGGVMVTLKDQDAKEYATDDIIECTSVLLQDLTSCGLAGEFLVFLLQELTEVIHSEIERTSADVELEEQYMRKLSILNLLATLCEKLGPDCIQNAQQTLTFVKATLERGIQVCRASDDVMTGLFETETITMAMGLLTALLTGAFELTVEDRTRMEDLSPLLNDLSASHPESSIQEMATDIRIAIATHGAVFSELAKSNKVSKLSQKVNSAESRGKSSKSKEKKVAKKPLIEVLPDKVEDNTEGHVSNMTSQSHTDHSSSSHVHTIDSEDKLRETETRSESIIRESRSTVRGVNDKKSQISRDTDATNDKSVASNQNINKTENVNSAAAVNIAGMGSDSGVDIDAELDLVFKELTDPLIPVRGHGLIRLTRMVKDRSLEVQTRQDMVLKIYLENLDHDDSYMYMSAINGLSAMADAFPDLVVPTVCKQFTSFDQQSVEGRNRSTELRMKLGEIMVKAARNLGSMIPKYRDVMLTSVLVGTRDEESLVRASSLSALGDICKLLHFSLGSVLHEVYECVSSLLKHDQDVQVRRAAGQCLTLLLQGSGDTTLKVLEPVIRDLYRTLKIAATAEKDDGVRQHISLALSELDQLSRKHLFPTQTLEKKIRVLDFN